jgi:hypothetical protein
MTPQACRGCGETRERPCGAKECDPMTEAAKEPRPQHVRDIEQIQGYLGVIAEMWGWDESDRATWEALQRLALMHGVTVPPKPWAV